MVDGRLGGGWPGGFARVPSCSRPNATAMNDTAG